MDDLLRDFIAETTESVEALDADLVSFEGNPQDRGTLDRIFRLLHTIKGTCGFLGLPRLEAVAHAGEDLLGQFRDGSVAVGSDGVTLILRSLDRIRWIIDQLRTEGVEPVGDDNELLAALTAASVADETAAAAAQEDFSDLFDDLSAAPPSDEPAGPAPAEVQKVEDAPGPEQTPVAAAGSERIRVSLGVLDELMTTVSELVLTRNQLMQIARQGRDDVFAAPLQRLSALTTELQDGVMKTRMQPISAVWKTLPRLVRDVARDLGKSIDLVTCGETVELDRQLLELIKDPLVHMVRNACDHGLETTEDRRAAGKPDTGVIRLSASHEAGFVIVRVSDDGRGLDTAVIRRKAVEKGLATAADVEAMSDAQVHRLIFAPGFSTAAVVTSVSGRGVGMDVVRANIEQIGGRIDLSSTLGVGTSFTVKIPLTLAIIPALIVRAAGQRFAVPQASVVELVRTGPRGGCRVEAIDQVKVLRLREELVPLIDMAASLGLGAADDRAAFVMVMQTGDQRFAVAVDAVLDTEEIVVKPLARALRPIPLYGGATILGDGSVALIIDPNGLAAGAGVVPAQVEASAESPAPARDRTMVLIVRAGPEALMAVELSRITRLELVDPATIERTGGRSALQYRDRLTPVVMLEGATGLPPGRSRQPLLMLTSFRHPIALAVDQIVDVIEDDLQIELAPDRPGVLGAAVVGGRAVEVVDIDWYLLKGMAEYGARQKPPLDQRSVA